MPQTTFVGGISPFGPRPTIIPIPVRKYVSKRIYTSAKRALTAVVDSPDCTVAQLMVTLSVLHQSGLQRTLNHLMQASLIIRKRQGRRDPYLYRAISCIKKDNDAH